MLKEPPPSPHSWAACPPWARQTLDRILTNRATPLDALWAHPERVMTSAGMEPDIWQQKLLRSFCDRVLLLSEGRIIGVGTLDELRRQTGLRNGSLEEIFLALT